MSENPKTLIAEANKVVADCETYLEAAAGSVLDMPARRKRVEERIAAAEEVHKQASEKKRRLRDDEDVGRAEVREAGKEEARAFNRVNRARQDLSSDDLDPENRKAVVRQLAGLIREDSEQRLRAIARRSDDPELQRTVSKAKEEVALDTRYVLQRFAEARPLTSDEVKKARTEARKLLAYIKTTP